MTQPTNVPADPADALASLFQQEQVDYVPDPLVLRAADLFIGGKEFVQRICPNPDIGLGADDPITPARVWATIDKNIDGLIAFFHLLMTRERVPLIDYDMTFDGQNLDALGGLAVTLHPPHDIYMQFKQDAQRKIAEMSLERLPKRMVKDIADELVSTGYGWLPDAGVSQPDRAQRTAAAFLMGGLIFGSYAAAIGGDHVLQSKRADLFTRLTIVPEERADWVLKKESELFAELDEIALKDPHIATRERHLPPTVLTLLIEDAKNPRDLLDRALRLRDEEEWKEYRHWYARLRKAWADGRHDKVAEADVHRVTEEIRRRLAQQQKKSAPVPLNEKEIAFKGKVEFGIAGFRAELEGDNLQRIVLPERLRNWYVDRFFMRDHRKLLMRMSVAQEAYDNLTLGLRNLWEGRA
jgi:hypothetical protein